MVQEQDSDAVKQKGLQVRVMLDRSRFEQGEGLPRHALHCNLLMWTF